jgi:Spy/CpxP family protein refolding chaperone
MLKHCLLLLLAASLIAIAAPFAAAQSNNDSNTAQPPAAQGQDHGAWRHGPQDPAGRTAELTRKLNLTPDQQTKVQDLFTAEHTQMEAVHQGSDQSDRRSKMMDIRKSTDTQVRALLDSDQQKKWDEMKAKREEGHHRGDNQAPPQQ